MLNKNEIFITGCNLTVLQVSALYVYVYITTTLLPEEHLALTSEAETVTAGIHYSETFTILFIFASAICSLFPPDSSASV